MPVSSQPFICMKPKVHKILKLTVLGGEIYENEQVFHCPSTHEMARMRNFQEKFEICPLLQIDPKRPSKNEKNNRKKICEV